MTKLEIIDADIRDAMKARDKDKLTYLRNFKSALKYKEIEKKDKLTEDEEITILSSVSKKLRDSIEQARDGDREDLATKSEDELKLLMGYLPEQMSPEEVEKIAREIIERLNDDGPLNKGIVMKNLMPKVKGKADGKVVNEIVQRLLN